MEMTIKQALQQGVTAHKDGQIEEAERFYRAILQSQPAHADANHNLGVIAVSVNKVALALPLFKKALKANPKIEQFWLSYIDALIKEKQFDNAKQVLEQAKKQGVAGKKLEILLGKLASINKIEKFPTLSPSQEQLNSLVEHYQNGLFVEAEKLAISLTKEYPKHQFGWKILGVLYGQSGRNSEAKNVNQTAISLSPQDAEAHNNLGSALNDLGRLNEAEDSYIRAIALKPDYAQAHSNLGKTLRELGRLEEAEVSYVKAIALKPDYAEAHSNLGNTLKELGRLNESEASYTQAISLKPDLAEAHGNLGITLNELGKLEEAEISYAKAIALKPNYAETHNNLGITLNELGRSEEAEISYSRAIELEPSFAEAHSNLGIMLRELGRLEEAEVSYVKAIALKPDYAEAHSNLGNTLKELGRLNESEASYTQAISLKPDYAEAMLNLSIAQGYMNDVEAEIVSLQNILQIDADNYGLRAGVNLGICNFLKGRFADSKKYLFAASEIQTKTSSKFQSEKVYRKYLLNVLSWHEEKYSNTNNKKIDKILYVVGESHSLVSHHLHVQISDSDILCEAKLIKGCKQWHLGNSIKNQYKNQFEGIFCSLPKFSEVLLTIGEVDCRLDSGIIKYQNKFPEKNIEKITISTIENYFNYIIKINSTCQHRIIIQGVPCPNIHTENCPENDVTQLIELINMFNYELETKAKERGFGFLDVHKLTDRGDGFSNAIWHIDSYHLSPEGFLEAWSRYISKLR